MVRGEGHSPGATAGRAASPYGDSTEGYFMRNPSLASTRARRGETGKRVLIAALAFLTIAAVAACVPQPSGGGGGGTPGAITITASSATIAYGDAVPAITPS